MNLTEHQIRAANPMAGDVWREPNGGSWLRVSSVADGIVWFEHHKTANSHPEFLGQPLEEWHSMAIASMQLGAEFIPA